MPKLPYKMTIGGIPVTVVSDEEAEKAGYWVCARWDDPSPFLNDLRAECSRCGVPLRHRPHAPKKPKKLCFTCFLTPVH